MSYLDKHAIDEVAQLITSKAKVTEAMSGNFQVIMIRISGQYLRIEITKFPRTYPYLECKQVKTQEHRALLRAVIDEIDRQVGK